MFNALVHRIPAEVLIDIYCHPKTNVSEVMRRLRSQFSTVAKTLDFLIYRNLIKSTKAGRDRTLILTRKGKSIAKNLAAIKKLLPG